MALEKFERSMNVNPNNKFALRNYAQCLLRLEMQEETYKKLDKIIHQKNEVNNGGEKKLSSNPIRLSIYSKRMQSSDQHFKAAIKSGNFH